MPSAPNTHAYASGPLPWAYDTPLDGLVVHTHQTPIHGGGLPSPALTGSGASPPGFSKLNASPVNNSLTPISPISPARAEGGSWGGFFNHQTEVLPDTDRVGTFLPFGNMNGVNLDWTNAHSHFDHTYPGFPTGQSAPPGVRTDFSPPWAQPTPLIHGLDRPILPRVTSFGDGDSTKRARTSDDSMQSPTPSHQIIAAKRSKTGHLSKKRRLPHLFEAPTGGETKSSVQVLPQPPAPGPSLRTAARRFKREAAPKPGDSAERQRAKANHNIVEQQYRHRLHARFEALLDVLPEGMVGGGDDVDETTPSARAPSTTSSSKKQRRMSKVDVLSTALEVIRFLEADNERARQEVEQLKRRRDAAIGGS